MDNQDLTHSALTLTCALRVSQSLEHIDSAIAEAILVATAFHLGKAMRRALETGTVSQETIDAIIQELSGHAGPH